MGAVWVAPDRITESKSYRIKLAMLKALFYTTVITQNMISRKNNALFQIGLIIENKNDFILICRKYNQFFLWKIQVKSYSGDHITSNKDCLYLWYEIINYYYRFQLKVYSCTVYFYTMIDKYVLYYGISPMYLIYPTIHSSILYILWND